MGPVKLCLGAGSVVVEDHLCASFTDHHALSSKFAITLVKVNMSDVRDLPAVGRRQLAVEIQEFIDAYFAGGEKVKVNANSVLIADLWARALFPGKGKLISAGNSTAATISFISAGS
jgi:hypothetical protein